MAGEMEVPNFYKLSVSSENEIKLQYEVVTWCVVPTDHARICWELHQGKFSFQWPSRNLVSFKAECRTSEREL